MYSLFRADIDYVPALTYYISETFLRIDSIIDNEVLNCGKNGMLFKLNLYREEDT